MKYTIQNNTILDNGFPLTLEQVVTLLNQKPEQKNSIDTSNGFAEFYRLYPKKVDKKKAADKWRTKGLFVNNGSLVINDLKRRLKQKDERFQRPKHLIKSPAVYLNNECWNDEIIQKKEHKKEWLTDTQVDDMARSGESYIDLFARLSAQGYNFNKIRS